MKKRYWLRGGLVGVAISLFILLPVLSDNWGLWPDAGARDEMGRVNPIYSISLDYSLLSLLLVVFYFEKLGIMEPWNHTGDWSDLVTISFIQIFIFGFVVGVLCGLASEKIKGRWVSLKPSIIV